MLDQSLFQSHFIGRDGFRWWIGQIPPVEYWQEQADQNGWGLRAKVRILGYHSLDPNELSNDDLPWAQIMLPTTAGSGSAFYGVNPKVNQGDLVIGFFLDGDNAQIPIIMGTLGKTSEWGNSSYQDPFVSFTGFTDNKPQPDPSMRAGADTNEATPQSQQPPAVLDPRNATASNPTAFSGTGTVVPLANTCENTSQSVIKSEIDKLLKWIQQAENKIGTIEQQIRKTAEVIKGALSWLLSQMFKRLESFLVGTQENPGIISRGIQALYTTVYGSVLAATGQPDEAHKAGCAAENACIAPVQLLEKALVCVKNAVLDELATLIVQLLNSLIQNVESFVTCAAEQFIGVVLNVVVDQVSTALTSALDGVLGILGVAFNVASFLREVTTAFTDLLDCGQSDNKCNGVKEWKVGVGPVSPGNTNIQNIFNELNNL